MWSGFTIKTPLFALACTNLKTCVGDFRACFFRTIHETVSYLSTFVTFEFELLGFLVLLFFLGKRLLLRLSYLRFLSISSPVGLQESVDRRLSVWNYTLLVDSSIANKSGLILMFILSSLSCSDRCLASARGLSCALVLGIDKCFLAWSTHSLKLHTPSRVLIQHRRRSVLV